MPNSEREQRIRERAFQIWIDEGQPEGKDKEHWTRATEEVEGDGEKSVDSAQGVQTLLSSY